MDIKKEAAELANEALENAHQTVSKGISFLRASLLRTLVVLSSTVSLCLLIITWNAVYASISDDNAFETFINTSMAIMASPLFLVAIYYYLDSLSKLMKKVRNMSYDEKAKHRKNLIIAGVTAGLAGWTIKLFFLPAVFFGIITFYMVKLIAVKQKMV